VKKKRERLEYNMVGKVGRTICYNYIKGKREECSLCN